jgi:GTP cyclohydrolase I
MESEHMSKLILTNKMVSYLATALAARIHCLLPEATKVFAIPRGGIPAALAVAGRHGNLQLVDDPAEADLFIDDIIDSGDTMRRWCNEYPGKPFFALIDKTEKDGEFNGRWVVFPWEETAEGSIEDNIRRLLQFIGENPKRGGLRETPRRVAKAWAHWCSGYGKNAADILKVFEDGAEKYDEMVVVKDIPIYSKCEHHLADIFGTATIAYIPNGKIVGLSKLSRLADMFARRLQVQERLTNQIADALEEHLQPKGVGVIIRARHMCMESRGICQQGHHTITCALRGVLKDKPEARAEFMELAK